jgi:hypothetical protein
MFGIYTEDVNIVYFVNPENLNAHSGSKEAEAYYKNSPVNWDSIEDIVAHVLTTQRWKLYKQKNKAE